MVNKPLLRPYFWGGGTLGGGRLTSHEIEHFVGTNPHPGFQSPPTLYLLGIPTETFICHWNPGWVAGRSKIIETKNVIIKSSNQKKNGLHIAY